MTHRRDHRPVPSPHLPNPSESGRPLFVDCCFSASSAFEFNVTIAFIFGVFDCQPMSNPTRELVGGTSSYGTPTSQNEHDERLPPPPCHRQAAADVALSRCRHRRSLSAAAIAIWLMSRARFGRPSVSLVVNVTISGGLSSCVIRGDHSGCGGITLLAGMRSRLRWMAGTSPGVLFLVFRQCVRDVWTRFLLAVGSRACIMAGLSVTL